MASRNQHPAKLRERAVAMVFELRAASGSSRGTLASVGLAHFTEPEVGTFASRHAGLASWQQHALLSPACSWRARQATRPVLPAVRLGTPDPLDSYSM
jgi:hypothetical protein